MPLMMLATAGYAIGILYATPPLSWSRQAAGNTPLATPEPDTLPRHYQPYAATAWHARINVIRYVPLLGTLRLALVIAGQG